MRVLSQLQVNSDFWSAYPIFIKNTYLQEQENKREVGAREEDMLSQQSPYIPADLRRAVIPNHLSQ